MSDMDIYLMDPLRSWESFSLWMSLTVSEQSPTWSANFLKRYRSSWRLCSVQSLWGYPLFQLVLQVYYRLSVDVSLWGLSIVPKVSLILGVFRSSRKDCFAIAIGVLGRLIPCLQLFLARDEEYFNCPLPFSLTGFRVQLSVLILCEEERIKIEVIK